MDLSKQQDSIARLAIAANVRILSESKQRFAFGENDFINAVLHSLDGIISTGQALLLTKGSLKGDEVEAFFAEASEFVPYLQTLPDSRH